MWLCRVRESTGDEFREKARTENIRSTGHRCTLAYTVSEM